MIQILELFGGIGAPRKALINLGIPHKSIDYVEWNEKAVRSYNAMFEKEIKYQPQSVVGWNLKPDILVHGSPCQDFSIGGKQYGGNVEDGTRSSLMFETLKIIENFGIWKPQVVIWENVPNVFSKKLVGAFQKYLSDMEKLGYFTTYKILNAMDFGIPQKRKRVFAISKLDGEPFNFDLLKHRPLKPLGNFLEVTTDQKYLVTQPSMLSKIRSKSSLANGFSGRLEVVNDFVYTITTRQDRCPNSGLIEYEKNKYRILTEKECWRLMGFDDDDFNNAKKANPGKNEKYKNTALYHQAGNSIVVPVLEAIFECLLPESE
ncbi:DNA cytosine methyltransferase [Enterococcus faecalis]|uniref:DNA cytosine methyltransferase n=1 Tax=Enterococcus faecalis TaxID=1351 RepID=UPI00155F526A|nr:DNA cytosine methyltransferase [Enterococcus faecalis]NRC97580.1 DNA cytosine methyltransferase [Enterococcus faecalis]